MVPRAQAAGLSSILPITQSASQTGHGPHLMICCRGAFNSEGANAGLPVSGPVSEPSGQGFV